ncbi:hypothetical protein G6F46_014255 [Rhizopus delemar]|nr:hypothetical protein G6F46_014255 [Rhizopus delemar]
MGVEVVGDLLQLPRRELLAGLDAPVLYLVVGEHQDRQHPAPVQRHAIDLAEGELLAPWRADHADEVAHRRQQLRGAAQQGLGAAAAGQLLAQAGHHARSECARPRYAARPAAPGPPGHRGCCGWWPG